MLLKKILLLSLLITPLTFSHAFTKQQKKRVSKLIKEIEIKSEVIRKRKHHIKKERDFQELFMPSSLKKTGIGWIECWSYYYEFSMNLKDEKYDAWKSCVRSYISPQYMAPTKKKWIHKFENILDGRK